MTNNPLLRSYKSRLLYTGVWAVITVVQTLIAHFAAGLSTDYAIADSVVFNALFACCALLLWYPVLHNSWRNFSWYYHLAFHLILPVLLLSVWLGTGFILMSMFTNDSATYYHFLRLSIGWKVLEGVFFYAVIVLMYYLYIYTERLNEKAANEIRMARLIKDGELNLLKSQINPHFLFNSLNSVNSLIIINPEQAQKMLVELSDYLRYTVLSTNRKAASLQDEIGNVERYLAIEKLRFGEKLNYNITIDPECLPLEIPSMLLQPLFENAVKHGVYESLQAVRIDVVMKKESGNLHIEISNDFDAGNLLQKKGSGIGLQNVRERLHLYYGDRAALHTRVENGKFIAVMKIPQVY